VNFLQTALPNRLTLTKPTRYPMENLHLKIRGLQDETCIRTLANAIQDLPNIGHIEISLEKGEANIEHGRFISPDDIVQAIVDAGFEAEY
jgi:copper chaperone